MQEINLKFLEELFNSVNFRFAKTMPKYPHWYTLRKEWNDDVLFDKVVIFIRKNGYKVAWGNREYIYFDVNGFHYWTMGSPVEKTILINKAEIK
jgi:hypothetical protein